MAERRMYIVVNASVKMSNGKRMAQVGHVVSQVTERMLKTARLEWEEYKAGGTTKIVCKATEEELENSSNSIVKRTNCGVNSSVMLEERRSNQEL